MFKDYYEVREWLESFIPYTYSKSNLGLECIKYLLNLLNNPQNKFKSIHIAGTSGKGSVAFYISRMLQLSVLGFQLSDSSLPVYQSTGKQKTERQRSENRKRKTDNWKIGLHLSPHLIDIRERMQIFRSYKSQVTSYKSGSNLMPMKRFLRLINEIKPVVESMKGSKVGSPSYFEILVAASFLYFAKEKVDWAVVEVGLGGRLDATNVLEPELTVITNVGLDHTEILGKTIEEIAFEKAGIIKSSVPVVTGCPSTHSVRSGSSNLHNSSGSSRKALEVIKGVAKQKKAPLITVDAHLGVKAPKSDVKSYLNSYKDILNNNKVFVTKDVFLLAISSLLSFGIKPTQAQIIEAFSSPFPARFEEIAPRLPRKTSLRGVAGRANVIIDGAHNLEKMKVLVHFLKKFTVHGSRFTVVIAFKKGKEWKKMLGYLFKNLDIKRCYATQFYAVTDTGLFAAVDPDEIKRFMIDDLGFKNSEVKAVENSQEAVFQALQSTVNREPSTVLITGSLYLAGEARTLWHLPLF